MDVGKSVGTGAADTLSNGTVELENSFMVSRVCGVKDGDDIFLIGFEHFLQMGESKLHGFGQYVES